MVDLGTYKDRFGDTGQRIFDYAMKESRRRDQNYIAVEHIIDAIGSEEAELFNALIRDLSLDPRAVRVQIERRLEAGRQHVGKGVRIAPETNDLFRRALERARGNRRKTIESTDLLMALSQEGALMDLLRNMGVAPEALVENVRSHVRVREQEEEQYKRSLNCRLTLSTSAFR